MNYSKLYSHLENSDIENYLLIAHERPDGDTIGAVLATGEFLRQIGKKVIAICSQEVPEPFRFLAGWQKIKSDFLLADFQTIILIDNGDLKRTGYLDRIRLAKSRRVPIINIDHHPKNDIWKLVSINIINEKASSTCEIVFDIIKKFAGKINAEIATDLLCGIYTDTGGFQHSNATPIALDVAAELLSAGANLKKISDNVSNFHSIARLMLWGIVLDRVQKSKNFNLIYSVVTRADLEKIAATDADLAGVVNIMSSVPDELASLLIYETADGKIKGSLRTESNRIDVSAVAALFAGGGHKKAAGFVVDGRIEKVGNGWKVV
ncbi:MAG: bifunctional oligoribonuclease/PAP phosphatase NrnA [Candidatus Berkelbacteria bacterium]|nr:bifunctional oligoribonuclease/PAP phosphatase NrnA [Candidatus Berkelbacteria bacterium]